MGLIYNHLKEGTGKPCGGQKSEKSMPASCSVYLNFDSGLTLGARVPTGSGNRIKRKLPERRC